MFLNTNLVRIIARTVEPARDRLFNPTANYVAHVTDMDGRRWMCRSLVDDHLATAYRILELLKPYVYRGQVDMAVVYGVAMQYLYRQVITYDRKRMWEIYKWFAKRESRAIDRKLTAAMAAGLDGFEAPPSGKLYYNQRVNEEYVWYILDQIVDQIKSS